MNLLRLTARSYLTEYAYGMPISSSEPCWPYGGTLVMKSSTWNVPLTIAPDGVMVTSTVADEPELMTTGENGCNMRPA